MRNNHTETSEYVKKIGRTPILTPLEELKLFKQLEEAFSPEEKKRIKTIIMEYNLRLVLKIAANHKNKALSYEDLIQEGITGLNRAIEKFDYKKGYKFSTYASWWIKQSLTRSCMDTGNIIRLPIHLNEFITAMRKQEAIFLRLINRLPTDEELADILGTTVKKIKHDRPYLNGKHVPRSFSEAISEDQSELEALIPGDIDVFKEATNSILKQHIKKLLSVLPERMSTLLTIRYGLDGSGEKTLDETGRYFGITRERVRQLEKQAFTLLKRSDEINTVFIPC
jgi:RNA polymerase primary sigma factor